MTSASREAWASAVTAAAVLLLLCAGVALSVKDASQRVVGLAVHPRESGASARAAGSPRISGSGAQLRAPPDSSNGRSQDVLFLTPM